MGLLGRLELPNTLRQRQVHRWQTAETGGRYHASFGELLQSARWNYALMELCALEWDIVPSEDAARPQLWQYPTGTESHSEDEWRCDS